MGRGQRVSARDTVPAAKGTSTSVNLVPMVDAAPTGPLELVCFKLHGQQEAIPT